MPPVYLGADLGGTHFRAALRAPGASTPIDCECVLASGEWGPGELLQALRGMLETMAARQGRPAWEIRAVGCALTGDIDLRAGSCHSMKRFPRLEDAPLAALLRVAFQAPAAILNDGLAAALAESKLGAGRGVDSFVMITLGTGIGGGVVMDGRLLTGPTGRIGKVGHQILDLDGPVRCHCGLPGCWQTLAGKEGVVARAREKAMRFPNSGLARLCSEGEEVDLKAVCELATAGDPAAAAVVEETGRYVGIGLANVVKLFAPELLLIGGGIAERNALLIEAARRSVDAYAIKPYQHVRVEAAALGTAAGVIGATLWAESAAP